MVLVLVLLAAPCVAEDWDVVLRSGEVFFDCKFLELRNDSVLVQTREWIDWLWLGNIARIERAGTGWGTGAIVGVVLGVGGGAWYAVEHLGEKFDQPAVIRGMVGGVLGAVPGGLTGALIGSMIPTGVSYDFSRMTYDEQLSVARKIILEH